MIFILVFGLTLFAGVLVSARASGGLLSTAVLFLVAGYGTRLTGLLSSPSEGKVGLIAELALVATLFTDGGKLQFAALRRTWRLPARALAFGLPLNLLLAALLARALLPLGWASRSWWAPRSLPPIPSSRLRSWGAKRYRRDYAVSSTWRAA